MMVTPGSWLSRCLALTLPAMAALLVWVMAVAPYLEGLRNLDTEIDLAARRIAALVRAAVAAEPIRAQAESLTDDLAKRNWTYRGITPDSASSALQQSVTELVRKSGAQVRSVQTLNADAREPLTQVSVVVQFGASLDSLASLLLLLDARRPLIFVQELSIRPNQGQFIRPAASSATQVLYRDDPVLDVMLKASAYAAVSAP